MCLCILITFLIAGLSQNGFRSPRKWKYRCSVCNKPYKSDAWARDHANREHEGRSVIELLNPDADNFRDIIHENLLLKGEVTRQKSVITKLKAKNSYLKDRLAAVGSDRQPDNVGREQMDYLIQENRYLADQLAICKGVAEECMRTECRVNESLVLDMFDSVENYEDEEEDDKIPILEDEITLVDGVEENKSKRAPRKINSSNEVPVAFAEVVESVTVGNALKHHSPRELMEVNKDDVSSVYGDANDTASGAFVLRDRSTLIEDLENAIKVLELEIDTDSSFDGDDAEVKENITNDSEHESNFKSMPEVKPTAFVGQPVEVTTGLSERLGDHRDAEPDTLLEDLDVSDFEIELDREVVVPNVEKQEEQSDGSISNTKEVPDVETNNIETGPDVYNEEVNNDPNIKIGESGPNYRDKRLTATGEDVSGKNDSNNERVEKTETGEAINISTHATLTRDNRSRLEAKELLQQMYQLMPSGKRKKSQSMSFRRQRSKQCDHSCPDPDFNCDTCQARRGEVDNSDSGERLEIVNDSRRAGPSSHLEEGGEEFKNTEELSIEVSFNSDKEKNAKRDAESPTFQGVGMGNEDLVEEENEIAGSLEVRSLASNRDEEQAREETGNKVMEEEAVERTQEEALDEAAGEQARMALAEETALKEEPAQEVVEEQAGKVTEAASIATEDVAAAEAAKIATEESARMVLKRKTQQVVKIQRFVKTYQERQKYLRVRNAILMIQRKWRAQLLMKETRSEYLNKQRAATMFQAGWVGYIVRKQIRKELGAILTIQSWWRMLRARKVFRRKLQHLVKIQRLVKAYQDRQKYLRLRNAALVIQRKWRATLLMEKTRSEYLKKQRAAILPEEALNRVQDEVSSEAIEEEVDLQEREAAREINTNEYGSEVHQVTENGDNGKERPVLGCNTMDQRNPNNMDEDVPMMGNEDLEIPLLRESENEPVKSQIDKEDKEMEKQIMEEGDREEKTKGEGESGDNLEQPAAAKEESSSEEDSSDEDEEPATNKAAPAPAGQKAVATKEESSSDEASSDEDEEPAANKAAPAPAGQKAVATKEESSSDEDSSDEDEEPDKDQEEDMEEVMKAKLFSLAQEGVYKLRNNMSLGSEDLPEGFLELLSDEPEFDITDLECAVSEYNGPLFWIK